jgi:hypothetical protein
LKIIGQLIWGLQGVRQDTPRRPGSFPTDGERDCCVNYKFSFRLERKIYYLTVIKSLILPNLPSLIPFTFITSSILV